MFLNADRRTELMTIGLRVVGARFGGIAGVGDHEEPPFPGEGRGPVLKTHRARQRVRRCVPDGSWTPAFAGVVTVCGAR